LKLSVLVMALLKIIFKKEEAEVLENTNQVILSKLSEKVKVDFAQTLYHQIEPKFSKDADVLRFLGTFFHIFQVPTNKRVLY
jgi:hypothetical protein